MFLLGTTPGYQKVFHEVMFPHHPMIIMPSLVALAFPDPGASQPSPLQGSLTLTPGDGGCWLQLSTGPRRKAIHAFHQRRVKPTAFSSQLGAEWSCTTVVSAPHVPLHVGLSLVASFGSSRSLPSSLRQRSSELDLAEYGICTHEESGNFGVFMISREQIKLMPAQLVLILRHQVHAWPCAQRTFSTQKKSRAVKKLLIEFRHILVKQVRQWS